MLWSWVYTNSLLFYELRAHWGSIWGSFLPPSRKLRKCKFLVFLISKSSASYRARERKVIRLVGIWDWQVWKAHGRKWIFLLIIPDIIINHCLWLGMNKLDDLRLSHSHAAVCHCLTGKRWDPSVKTVQQGSKACMLSQKLCMRSMWTCSAQGCPFHSAEDTLTPLRTRVWHPLPKKEAQAEFALLECCHRGRDGGDRSTAVKPFSALRTQPGSCLCLWGFNPTLPTASAYRLSWQEAVSAASAESQNHSAENTGQQGKKQSPVLQSTSGLQSK